MISICLLFFIHIHSSRAQQFFEQDSCSEEAIIEIIMKADSIYKASSPNPIENERLLWMAVKRSQSCENWNKQVYSLLSLSTLYSGNRDDLNFRLTIDLSLIHI